MDRRWYRAEEARGTLAAAVAVVALACPSRAIADGAPLPPLPVPTVTAPMTAPATLPASTSTPAPPSESPPAAPAATGSPPEPEPQPPPEVPPARPRSPAIWSIGFNPLALFLGRLGGDIEYLIAPYFALIGNLHVDRSTGSDSSGTADYWGFGGEAGVRLYTRGHLYGFFLGTSLVAGWYQADYYGYGLSLPDVGFAMDMGGKAKMGESMFLTAGGGLQRLYTRPYPSDIAGFTSLVIGSGWDPRVLLTIGAMLR